MKKSTIVLILITMILATMLGSSLFCYAESTQSDFETIVTKMKEAYLNAPEGILTVTYYGYINEGENILADNNGQISDELVNEFRLYKFYYFRTKALDNIEKTFISSSYTVKFENKSFYFYDDQWGEVENVYNVFSNKIQTATVDDDLDELFSAYYLAVDSLVDKNELDELIASYVINAVKSIDTAVVKRVNVAIAQSNLQTISKDDIPTYSIYSNTEIHDNWFAEVLSLGYSTQNALKVDRIYSNALDSLKNQPRNAEENVYQEIANSAISEIEKIEVESNKPNDYLLETRKQSALIQIEFFLQSESYTEADKDIQNTFKRITDNAISKIQDASTIAEVDKILNETLNALADVEVGGNDWIKLMSVGIVLGVLLIIAVVVLIIKKKKGGSKKLIETDENDESHEQSNDTDKQATLKNNESINSEIVNKDKSLANSESTKESQNDDPEGDQA